MRLLIVEDNARLSDWLARLLRAERFVVDCVPDGETALEGVDLSDYDLLVVDLGLPGIDGIEVIRRVRAREAALPILILSAEAALTRRVEGLDAGADDYLTKPFEADELAARIRALMRRRDRAYHAVIRFGPLAYDQTDLRFSVDGAALDLTPREHRALDALIRRAGAVVSKEVLIERCYGHDDDVSPSAVEVIVHRLRRKLEPTRVGIATLRGLGYVLREEAP